MNDKELAEAVMALGIGTRKETMAIRGNKRVPEVFFIPPGGGIVGCDVDEFVREWRVAGVCLEHWPTTINVEHLDCTLDEMLRDPRAIIEARVRADQETT